MEEDESQSIWGIGVFVLLLMLVVYLTPMAFDYSFTGEGFSPFKIWSPVQTALFAFVGIISVSALILYNMAESKFDSKGLIHLPIVIALSFLILFSIDSRQILQYLPFLQFLLINEFVSLFLFGGLMGIYITYLTATNTIAVGETPNPLVELGLRSLGVIFVGALPLTLLFAFGIAFFQTIGLYVFPFYGEGTFGAVLVVSVLLGMYLTARIIDSSKVLGQMPVGSGSLRQFFEVVFEFVVMYFCTVAGFSLIGGFVTDGSPVPELVPFSIVILGLYAVIPFSILLVRHKVFPKSHSPDTS